MAGENMKTELELMMETWQEYSDPRPHYELSQDTYQVARTPGSSPLFCRRVLNIKGDRKQIPVLQTNDAGDRLGDVLKYVDENFLRCQTEGTEWQQYTNGSQRWMRGVYIMTVNPNSGEIVSSPLGGESYKIPTNDVNDNWRRYIESHLGARTLQEMLCFIEDNYATCPNVAVALWEGS
jgi:hypothetical protein